MEKAIKTNKRENVHDKDVQVPKQVLGWLPCQVVFFRFTHLHLGFSIIHVSCKLLSERRKSQMFSILRCG